MINETQEKKKKEEKNNKTPNKALSKHKKKTKKYTVARSFPILFSIGCEKKQNKTKKTKKKDKTKNKTESVKNDNYTRRRIPFSVTIPVTHCHQCKTKENSLHSYG